MHGEKISKKIQQRPASAISNAPVVSRPVLRPSSAMNPIVKVPSNSNLVLGAGAAAIPKPQYDPAKIYKNPISPLKKINPILRKSIEKKVHALVVPVGDKKKSKDADIVREFKYSNS